MNESKIILVNIRGNLIPMNEEQYQDFKSDQSWMDDMFDCKD